MTHCTPQHVIDAAAGVHKKRAQGLGNVDIALVAEWVRGNHLLLSVGNADEVKVVAFELAQAEQLSEALILAVGLMRDRHRAMLSN